MNDTQIKIQNTLGHSNRNRNRHYVYLWCTNSMRVSVYFSFFFFLLRSIRRRSQYKCVSIVSQTLLQCATFRPAYVVVNRTYDVFIVRTKLKKEFSFYRIGDLNAGDTCFRISYCVNDERNGFAVNTIELLATQCCNTMHTIYV